MNLGIVGSEASKFTLETETQAKEIISQYIDLTACHKVVSGGCHLGGIDIWAKEVAQRKGIEVIEHLPTIQKWEGGYKQRNIKIAKDSDYIICITVRILPSTYSGMRFSFCYHCNTKEHIKSGGCWTVKKAKELGKKGEVIVI